METTRRNFLGGLAVASALSSASIVHAADAPEVEAPELLALGGRFDAAHQAFLAAADRLAQFQSAYRAIAPNGEGLVFEQHCGHSPYDDFLEVYIDPACPKATKLKGEKGFHLRRVNSYHIDRLIQDGLYRDSPAMRDLRGRTIAFEQAIEAALRSSGLADALKVYLAAESALRRSVSDLVSIRARTTVGLALKVRATSAYAALGHEETFLARMWISNAIWHDLAEETLA